MPGAASELFKTWRGEGKAEGSSLFEQANLMGGLSLIAQRSVIFSRGVDQRVRVPYITD